MDTSRISLDMGRFSSMEKTSSTVGMSMTCKEEYQITVTMEILTQVGKINIVTRN